MYAPADVLCNSAGVSLSNLKDEDTRDDAQDDVEDNLIDYIRDNQLFQVVYSIQIKKQEGDKKNWDPNLNFICLRSASPTVWRQFQLKANTLNFL